MIFSVFVILIFVVVSVYYYFRAEKLSREIYAIKKESAVYKKEAKLMIDTFAIVAKKNEEIVKFRFEQIQKNNDLKETTELLLPLVNNYAAIFSECIRGKGRLHKIVQKCCESYQEGSYKKLAVHINQQEAHIKRNWSSNNITGFISFLDAILLTLDKQTT